MLLAIEQGNTNTLFAVHDGTDWIAQWRTATEAARFGVPVTALPIEFKTIAGFLALRRHLASTRPDVVNTHSSADSWLVALACATLSSPPAIVRTRHISAPVSARRPTARAVAIGPRMSTANETG